MQKAQLLMGQVEAWAEQSQGGMEGASAEWVALDLRCENQLLQLHARQVRERLKRGP